MVLTWTDLELSLDVGGTRQKYTSAVIIEEKMIS